jgi:primary-amine oxidase
MSTAAIETLGQTGPAAPDHSLTPLTADEIRAVRRSVDAHNVFGDASRFVYVALDEPHKATVLSFRAGDPIDRRARVVLLDRATGQGTDLVVSITEGRVVHQVSIDAATEGHVPILDEEFEDIELFLLDSPEWLAAMGKRGIDTNNVRVAPLSACVFGPTSSLDQADLPWALSFRGFSVCEAMVSGHGPPRCLGTGRSACAMYLPTSALERSEGDRPRAGRRRVRPGH